MSATVVFLDDDEDLRMVICDVIRSQLGLNCHAIESLDDLKKHNSDVLKSALVIIDINLGANKPTGLDAAKWLQENHYRGKMVFFTGHAQSHPQVINASKSGIHVWAKPMAADQLIQAIKEELPQEIK